MQRSARESKSRVDGVFLGVLGCFILSGFAALLYQTAWMRQFSIVFGTSELAVATVLASYMAGLAGGSAVAARYVKQIRRPVWVYGLLELGVAVGALAIPVALNGIEQIRIILFGGQPEPPGAGGVTNSIFYLVFAFLLLALPTGCMGATLPMLTRTSVHNRDQIGSRVGILYAFNTGGAVLGTLVAAFFLLPTVGLWTTLLVGAVVNLAVFGIAVWISRVTESVAGSQPPASTSHAEGPRKKKKTKSRSPAHQTTPDRSISPGLIAREWVLPLMLMSGAISFTYEVLWSRLLSHILGGSIFAFATMLASFLTGITIGSALGSRFAKDRDRSAIGLSIAQYATAFLSIVIYFALDYLPELAIQLQVGESNLLRSILIAAMVLLPATVSIGATFPFAVRVLAVDETDAARASARVYAWNTAGAIAGALLAGFVLLPALKFSGVIRLAVGINLLLGWVALWLGITTIQRNRLMVAGLISVAGLVLFQPSWPVGILRTSPFAGQFRNSAWKLGDILYYGVGRSSTVLMIEDATGVFSLRNNGLPESTIAPRGSVTRVEERLLGGLPVLVRPAAQEMLVIGFGGGVALSGIPPSVQSIDVIELEPEVITANRSISEDRLDDPLADTRLNLIMNDARGSLMLTEKRYDAIVSQPSHPWSAGASHLYTYEFMTSIRDHLHPGGVFLQWMDASFVDHVLLRQLGATLLEIFPYVELYTPIPGYLIFLSSDEPIEPEMAFSGEVRLAAGDVEHFHRLGVVNSVSVVAMLALDHEGLQLFCHGAPITTDDHNFIATGSPRVIANPLGRNAFRVMLPFDPLLSAERAGALFPDGKVEWIALVRELWKLGSFERATVAARLIEDEEDQLLALGIVLPDSEAQEQLRQAVRKYPDNDRARYLLVATGRAEIARGVADSSLMHEARQLKGAERAVVQGWQYLESGDFSSLAQLDTELGTAGPADLCYGQAVQLRAHWRALNDDANSELGAEALQILDEGFRYFQPDESDAIMTHLTRLIAASLADRPYVLLDSARRMANLFPTELEELQAAGFSDRTARLFKSRALRRVETLKGDPRVSNRRFESTVALLSR